MRFLNLPASSMRTVICVSMVSKTRGGAKKYVGPISRRSSIAVSGLSGQATQRPPA
jgi:hypothetical protein